MYEVRSIKSTSLAKIVATISVVMYVLLGVLLTLVYSVAQNLVLVGNLASRVGPLSFLLVWLAGSIAILLVSWITGLLIGGTYNLIARWWGGFRFNLVQIEKPLRSGRIAGDIPDHSRERERPQRSSHSE